MRNPFDAEDQRLLAVIGLGTAGVALGIGLLSVVLGGAVRLFCLVSGVCR